MRVLLLALIVLAVATPALPLASADDEIYPEICVDIRPGENPPFDIHECEYAEPVPDPIR